MNPKKVGSSGTQGRFWLPTAAADLQLPWRTEVTRGG